MSVSSGGSLSSATSFRRLSHPSSEYSSVDRQNQPLSTPPERPLLNHNNFGKAMIILEGIRRDFMNSQESSALVRMTAASDQIVIETMVSI